MNGIHLRSGGVLRPHTALRGHQEPSGSLFPGFEPRQLLVFMQPRCGGGLPQHFIRLNQRSKRCRLSWLLTCVLTRDVVLCGAQRMASCLNGAVYLFYIYTPPNSCILEPVWPYIHCFHPRPQVVSHRNQDIVLKLLFVGLCLRL